MITLETELQWWNHLYTHLCEYSPIPVLVLLSPPCDPPYVVLEKSVSLRSFDGMRVEFSVHFFQAEGDSSGEYGWIQILRDRWMQPVKMPLGTACFREEKMTWKTREKKGRTLTLEYQGLVKLRPQALHPKNPPQIPSPIQQQ